MEQIHRYLACHAAGIPVPDASQPEQAREPLPESLESLDSPDSPDGARFAALRHWYGFPSGGGFRPALTRPDFLPDFLGTGHHAARVLAGRRPPIPLPLEQVSGRVLAEAIRADRDQPPFARATRDGFAVRADEAAAGQTLLVTGHLRAGQRFSGPQGSGVLAPGEACEIMTGAAVPPGADAVVMVEHCEQFSNCIRLAAGRSLAPGENIVPQAAEARAADLLVPAGVRLRAAQIAVAAQNGYRELSVVPRPRVAILTTGDELVPHTQQPGPVQIRNSNAAMLAALVQAIGGEAIVLPPAADRADALDASLQQALNADLLLVSGGISVGRYDLVEDALTRAGARFFFGGVAIQPGKPVAFGQLPRPTRPNPARPNPAQPNPAQPNPAQSNQGHSQARPMPFLALPGNPISSAVTFHLFAAPLIAGLAEDVEPQPRFALAQFTGSWHGRPGLTRFLPAACDFSASPQVRLVPWQGSGDLAALARSNCFLAIADDADSIADGSMVPILLA